MDDIIIMKRCASCPEMVLYWGPTSLRNASVWCSDVCEALWDAITPGRWIDAAELMPGGCLHDRPDIWISP